MTTNRRFAQYPSLENVPALITIYFALSSPTVLIYDQFAESHMVSTRKTIIAMHIGPLFRITSTGRKVGRN
jgi:hypothetical protein